VATLAGAPLLLGGAAGIVVAALAIALVAAGAGDHERHRGGDRGHHHVRARGAARPLALLPPGIQDLLFGDILGVSNGDLLFAAGAAVAALAALRLSTDSCSRSGSTATGARALGASPALAETALLILIALAVLDRRPGPGQSACRRRADRPAATARLICTRLLPMMGVAAGVANTRRGDRLYVSYYAGTAAGASVAGALVALFLLTAIASATSGRSTEVAL